MTLRPTSAAVSEQLLHGVASRTESRVMSSARNPSGCKGGLAAASETLEVEARVLF